MHVNGNYYFIKNLACKIKMKTPATELVTLSAWGLHFYSFVVASIPFLQAASLLFATTASILTIRKLVKDSKDKRRTRKG